MDKIVKGAIPVDLPVEQASRLELAINSEIAKALELDIPRTMMERADKLIG